MTPLVQGAELGSSANRRPHNKSKLEVDTEESQTPGEYPTEFVRRRANETSTEANETSWDGRQFLVNQNAVSTDRYCIVGGSNVLAITGSF